MKLTFIFLLLCPSVLYAAAGDYLFLRANESGPGTTIRVTPHSNDILGWSGTTLVNIPRSALGGGGGGSLSSVELTMPAVFTVDGSPLIADGTIAVTLATQLANKVWASPASGAAAAPTFRALVAGDLPDLSSVYQPFSAVLSTFTTNGSAYYLARGNHTGTQLLATISDAGALAALSVVTTTQITDGTIANADISTSAAIALSKLATDPLARANHTGTQALATISDAGALAALSAVTTTQITDGTILDADISVSSNLAAYAGVAPSANILSLLGAADYAAARIQMSLGNVENTALSTWSGSVNITTLGTLSAGAVPTTLLTGTITDAQLAGSISNSKLATDPLNASNLASGTVPAARLGSGASGATKFLRVDNTWQDIPGGGDALTANPLSQFAATTSAQLLGVLTDESGTGNVLTTNGSAAALTSFPTLNQNTTGSAATLTTPRAINGVNFDGSTDITVAAAASTLSGTTLASNIVSSSLTSVGTLTSGTWTAGTIDIEHGGTSSTTAGGARTALGLGTLATQNGTFSGTSSGTNTGDQTTITGNAGTATALATGRTLAITGDLVWTSPSFDGSGNVTAVGTLATVNSNIGSFGSATTAPAVTVNAKGLVTGVTTNTITPAVGSITGLGVNVASSLANATSGVGTLAITSDITKTAVGLSNVTDDVQTKAAVVPNTTPTPGQVLVGNAGGTAYAPASVSGDATLASTGALTLANTAVTAGTYGSATQSLTATTDAKGRLTALSAQTVTPAVSSITGLGTDVAPALAINIGSAGALVLFNGAGGTPASINLSNGSNLPVSGIVSSTSTTLGLGSIELGHSSDTTLARSSAGNITVEGQTIYRAGGSFTGMPVEIVIACSDETTALTTGTAKVTFRMPHSMTLSSVRLNVNTAPTGAAIVVDMKEAGTTVFSTKPQIDATAKTSVGGAVPGVVSDTSLADDAEITINLDQVGATIAGKGLKVTLIGTR